MVFRPSLEMYDVLIHLVPKQVPLLTKAVDPPLVTFQQGVFKDSAITERALPVIDYDPVKLYLSELRVCFFLYNEISITVSLECRSASLIIFSDNF